MIFNIVCTGGVKFSIDCSVDYEALRALDADNVSNIPSMSEEEINVLPVHKYKVTGPERYGTLYYQRVLIVSFSL